MGLGRSEKAQNYTDVVYEWFLSSHPWITIWSKYIQVGRKLWYVSGWIFENWILPWNSSLFSDDFYLPVAIFIHNLLPRLMHWHQMVHPFEHWVLSRFFDEDGHETIYASGGNKHFFAKLCHHQTYQKNEQSRQKLGSFLENKVF